MREYSDEEIIDSFRTRKSYVVQYLFDRFLPIIRTVIYRTGGTEEDVKDIFQDALLIIILKIDKNDLVLSCNLKTFLYSICKNLWNKKIDKNRISSNYLAQITDNPFEKDLTEEYENKIYENMIYDMFEILDPVCKKILKLYLQGLTIREIAEKLGYQYGYVKKKKCTCQSELINKVKNHPAFKSI